MATLAEVSLIEAERIGRLRLGTAGLPKQDADALGRIKAMATERMAGYAAVNAALSRIDDKGVAKTIRRRVKL